VEEGGWTEWLAGGGERRLVPGPGWLGGRRDEASWDDRGQNISKEMGWISECDDEAIVPDYNTYCTVLRGLVNRTSIPAAYAMPALVSL
jgi:hypothetical protein